jgi:hypothetical protein
MLKQLIRAWINKPLWKVLLDDIFHLFALIILSGALKITANTCESVGLPLSEKAVAFWHDITSYGFIVLTCIQMAELIIRALIRAIKDIRRQAKK